MHWFLRPSILVAIVLVSTLAFAQGSAQPGRPAPPPSPAGSETTAAEMSTLPPVVVSATRTERSPG